VNLASRNLLEIKLCWTFGVAGFPGQMRGNGAIDYAQYLAHDGRLAGIEFWYHTPKFDEANLHHFAIRTNPLLEHKARLDVLATSLWKRF